MNAIALPVVLALCAGQGGFAGQCAPPLAPATGAASAQSANASAPIGSKGTRTLVVHGKVFDLDAPLPVAPRTLPDGHPLLRETAVADDSHEFGGRLAPGFDTPGRRAIHDTIVADAVAGVTPQASPVLSVMAGGSGSGKGFVRARLEATGEIPTRNRVLIDPDEILVRLPEWQPFKDVGDGRAATILHEESSLLAKRIRALAAARRLDVVLDVTLSDAGSARAMFEQFRGAGYAIHLFAVATDAQVSAAQAADRARQSNRWVPWSVLLEAHRAIAAAFEGYARLADRASLFENTGEQPRQIAERDAGGGLRVLDAPAYRRWLESSRRINPAARTLGEIYERTPQ
jgi:predicted ABC-type ATPase